MSQQLKALAQSFIADVIDEFLKLAITVPPDRWTWRPGPTARSAQEIVWHVALGLHFMAPSLRGEKPTPPNEQWLAQFKERHATQESLKAFIQENLRELWSAIDRVEDLAQPCFMYWGDRWPAEKVLLRGCAEHTAYHSGQLAYIQRLLGDTEDHF
ncbi:MAG: DinB family protein [Candidatus Bipolaricaulota bacterium]|nr:DinB family protein [Candidatus Bipolaricaulota bacterium]